MSAVPLLEIDGLSVRFGATTVVDRISFSIAAGEKFALVGESALASPSPGCRCCVWSMPRSPAARSVSRART